MLRNFRRVRGTCKRDTNYVSDINRLEASTLMFLAIDYQKIKKIVLLIDERIVLLIDEITAIG
jgi:hypothetical protein